SPMATQSCFGKYRRRLRDSYSFDLSRINALAITEAAHATLARTLPFPEIVGKLISAGVDYYHVDYVGMCKQFYDGEGGRVVTPIPCEACRPSRPSSMLPPAEPQSSTAKPKVNRGATSPAAQWPPARRATEFTRRGGHSSAASASPTSAAPATSIPNGFRIGPEFVVGRPPRRELPARNPAAAGIITV
ncbi:MAG TPA: hypothetical protein VGH74_14405, partial [Planctomycetaceae bacterium]